MKNVCTTGGIHYTCDLIKVIKHSENDYYCQQHSHEYLVSNLREGISMPLHIFTQIGKLCFAKYIPDLVHVKNDCLL